MSSWMLVKMRSRSAWPLGEFSKARMMSSSKKRKHPTKYIFQFV